MFCPKCGTQALDGAAFCQKCGAKLIIGDTEQQAAASTPAGQVQSRANNPQSDIPQKKKSKKLPIILAAIGLVFVVILIAANSSELQERGEQARKDEEYIASQQQSSTVNLSETYTNDPAGISFHYPAGWVILDSESEFQVVNIIDSQNNADSIASFKVFRIFDQDPYGVFTKDEATVRETVNENATFLKSGDTLLGDVPAKSVTYQKAGLKGEDIITNFWYVIGEDVYQIACSYSASKADTYEPIFAAIMDSYTIVSPASGTMESSIYGDSDVTYYVEFSESYSEGYEPTVVLYQDGSFSFLANQVEAIGFYNGTYSVNGDIYTFNVTETEFYGNKTSYEFEFVMRLNGDTLIYESLDPLGMTNYGAVFSLSATTPKSIIDAYNYEGTYEGEIPFGYEGEEGEYVPTQEVGFPRSEYFTGITYMDLLRYPDNHYNSKLYLTLQVVTEVLEPRVYVVKGADFSGNDGKLLIIDDRNGTGANAVKGDRVAVYGRFSEMATLNFTDGHSEQLPHICADRFIVNMLLPNDISDFTQGVVATMNNHSKAYGYGSEYIGDGTAQLIVGCQCIETVGGTYKTNIQILQGTEYLQFVDGYSVIIKPEASSDVASPIDAGIEVSTTGSEFTPIRMNGYFTKMEQNPMGPYLLTATFVVTSLEAY